MGNVIDVTEQNFVLCGDALRSLRRNLPTLVEMTREHPIECSFGSYSFLFKSKEDIDKLIRALEQKLKDYHPAQLANVVDVLQVASV